MSVTLPPDVRLEPAGRRDAGTILTLIRELADYEKLSHEVMATEADLVTSLFGPFPVAQAVIAYSGQEPVGFAVYFFTFSTFLAKPGLYLEDLFVRPEWRRQGIGRALLAHLAAIAVERGCGRMEWSVLDWNEMALGVYRSIGARPMSEWTVQRLTGSALAALAAAAPGAPRRSST